MDTYQIATVRESIERIAQAAEIQAQVLRELKELCDKAAQALAEPKQIEMLDVA